MSTVPMPRSAICRAASRVSVLPKAFENVNNTPDFERYHGNAKAAPHESPASWFGQRSQSRALLRSPAIRSSSSVGWSVRQLHTDLVAPDMGHYRHKDTKDPQSRDAGESRKSAAYAVTGASLMGLGVIGKGLVHPIVKQWTASADVLALAKIELSTAEIPVGKNLTVKWRGKPLFVRHRTEAEIASAVEVDVNSLRDPQHDKDRCADPNCLVVMGICTHLGCVPISHQGAYNGYYCPCHGSHYDTSGRIRQGPAPANLEVPEYSFEGDLLIVG
jgi:ubiquinol-cytochrome c reductase iron-sulfur subunit